MNTAFPPHRVHSSFRIPPTEALGLLSNYLENAATDPSLHPNAILSENGPITPSSGSDTGLVIHNLRRLQAGLKGEHIDFELGDVEGTALQEDVPMVNGVDYQHHDGTNGDMMNGTGQEEEEESGWQSIAEFEREQEVVEGDLGDRGRHVVDDNEEGGEVQPRTVVRGDFDKEARKQAKKERHKKIKRELEEKRKKEGNP